MRCEKRIRGRGTFRENIACDNLENAIARNKGAEESSRFHDNNTIIHVYATQWVEYYFILYGDHYQECNDRIDRAFVSGDDRYLYRYD